MSSDNPSHVADMQAMLDAGDVQAIRAYCEDTNPAVIGELVSDHFNDDAWAILKHIPLPLRSEVFSHLDEDLQVDIVASLPRNEVARLLTDMPPDDRADLFKRLPEDRQDNVLPALAQAEREDLRRLSAYAEGTVGAVMTSDYATLAAGLTAAEAIDRLRVVAPDRETIYYAYIVDAEHRLLGFLSLKDLILAPTQRPVADILQRDIIYARVDEDQETAARRLQKYDLIAMPVVDARNTMVGILTHDNAFDVLVQEQQEDLEKLVAITGSHEAGIYLKKSPWEHFLNRVLWILGLAGLGLISGQIVQGSQGMLLLFPILTIFMPMLAATGGNTGSQATTLVIRALAVQEITPRDILRVLWKELRVGLLLSVVLAGAAFLRVMLQGGGQRALAPGLLPRVGLAIATALALQVISSTLIGALLPLGAARLKWDPAVVASPTLTTLVDITGLLIYFSVASWMLGGAL